MNTIHHSSFGFTLIEMLVAMSLYTMVATIVTGSLLVLLSGNGQLQGEQSLINNLSFALDSMTREIRTGTHYYCSNGDFSTQESLGINVNDCESGRRGISFRESGTSLTVGDTRIAYYYDTSTDSIMRRIGDTTAMPIVSSGIEVIDVDFYVTDSDTFFSDTDTRQPTVTIVIEAREEGVAGKTYIIQTTVTQRQLDLMNYHSSQSGFSLVEVLVAITILLLVVTGPMTIISRSNSSTAFATEQINAFFLAQEGLELAQKGRDDLLLRYLERQITGSGGITNPIATFTATYSQCFTATGCGLTIGSAVPAAVSVTSCSGGNCQLYLDTSTSIRPSYVHTATADITPYTRTIIMERFPDTGKVEEIKVTSRVTWRTGSLLAGQQVELITYLANVYDAD